MQRVVDMRYSGGCVSVGEMRGKNGAGLGSRWLYTHTDIAVTLIVGAGLFEGYTGHDLRVF